MWYEPLTVDELLRIKGVSQPPWQSLDPPQLLQFTLQLVQRNTARLVPIVSFLDPQSPWLAKTSVSLGWHQPYAWERLSDADRAEYSNAILGAFSRFIELGGKTKVFADRDIHPVHPEDADLGTVQFERPLPAQVVDADAPKPYALFSLLEWWVMVALADVKSLTPSNRSVDHVGHRYLIFDGLKVRFEQSLGQIRASVYGVGQCRFDLSR